MHKDYTIMTVVDKNQQYHWLYGIKQYFAIYEVDSVKYVDSVIESLLHRNPWQLRDLIISISRTSGNLERDLNAVLMPSFDIDDFCNTSVLLGILYCLTGSEFIKNIKSWYDEETPEDFNDHFSSGQILSKCMVADYFGSILNDDVKTIVIYGGWYGMLIHYLEHVAPVTGSAIRYVVVDSDPVAVRRCKKLMWHLGLQLRVQVICSDVDYIYNVDGMMYIPANDDVHEVDPDLIINTSSEHMNNEWFAQITDGTRVILQTNDFHDCTQHINTVNSMDEVMEQYSMTTVDFTHEKDIGPFTRYMLAGTK